MAKRKVSLQASPSSGGLSGFLRRAAVGIASPNPSGGVFQGFQAGLGGAVAQGQAEQNAAAQDVQNQIEQALKARQVGAQERTAEAAYVKATGGPEGGALGYIRMHPEALDTWLKMHPGRQSHQAALGTESGVAPMGFLGPLPPGQIHAENLPTVGGVPIPPSDYPTYTKAEAQAAGRRAGAPLAIRPVAQTQQDVDAIHKVTGLDPAFIRTNLKLGTWKVSNNADSSSTVYDNQGNSVTHYFRTPHRLDLPLPSGQAQPGKRKPLGQILGQ